MPTRRRQFLLAGRILSSWPPHSTNRVRRSAQPPDSRIQRSFRLGRGGGAGTRGGKRGGGKREGKEEEGEGPCIGEEKRREMGHKQGGARGRRGQHELGRKRRGGEGSGGKKMVKRGRGRGGRAGQRGETGIGWKRVGRGGKGKVRGVNQEGRGERRRERGGERGDDGKGGVVRRLGLAAHLLILGSRGCDTCARSGHLGGGFRYISLSPTGSIAVRPLPPPSSRGWLMRWW